MPAFRSSLAILAGASLIAFGGVASAADGPSATSPKCAIGEPWLTAELFFGLSLKGGGQVSDAEWTRFLDVEVTPRFPDGLTVYDAQGRWRGPDGRIVREPSKAVLIVTHGGAEDQAKLEAVRAAYRRLYDQDSVLEVVREACASF